MVRLNSSASFTFHSLHDCKNVFKVEAKLVSTSSRCVSVSERYATATAMGIVCCRFVGVESRNDDDVDEHDDDVFLRGGDVIKDDGDDDDDDDDDDDFCVGINPLWDPHAIPSGSLPFSSSDVPMCLLLALDAASDKVEVAAICFPDDDGFCVGGKDNDDDEEEEDADEDCGGSCGKDDPNDVALRFDDDDDEDDVLPP